MEKEQGFDFENFKQEAIKGMYAGKPLNGEKGIFAPLLKHFLESALAGELEAHLQEEKAAGLANRKNGKSSKKVKSLSGEFQLETTCDRSGSFEPLVLPKRQLIITEELEEKVIGLYGLGMSTRDITKYVKDAGRWISLLPPYWLSLTKLFRRCSSGAVGPRNQFTPLFI